MKILSFDTTLAACSVACVAVDPDSGNVDILAASRKAMARGHAEALVPMIERTMADTGIEFAQLDRIAVTTGPGSFTGLRVGIATARGLGLALGIPVTGVVTLDALARDFVDANPDSPKPFAILLDARRGQLYIRNYDTDGIASDDPSVCDVADAADRIVSTDCLLVGPGSGLLVANAPDGFAHGGIVPLPFADGPSAVNVAKAAALTPPPARPPSPLYLRPADVKPQSHKSLARR